MNVERSSLVKKFSLLLILASFVGALLYLGLFFGGQVLTEKYIEHSSYIENQAAKRIENFQTYITQKGITPMNAEAISEWGKKNSIVLMEIYRGRYLLYSTAAPEDFYTYENTEEATLYDWATYHTVTFADGDAQVVVYADDLSLWNFWLILISAAISIIVALILFLSGCKRIVKQICILNERVRRMEAGDLDAEIPTMGNHELGQLAQNLNSMRCALKEQMEHEKAIFHAHQTMITEMSHDLRTPLTTLQIYTDILRYKKCDPAMVEHHLDLIDAKACQIKQLADNIFEYSLVSRQQEIELEPPVPARQIFHDLLSEYIYQWSRHGFGLDFELDWTDIRISVYSPYIKRTMDNISSNLMKYASKDHRVLIKIASEQNYFCITVQNKIISKVSDEESTHIGLANIEMMMQKMNGACKTQEDKDRFSITLCFPACTN